MEEEVDTSSGNFLAVSLALLGIAMGGAALYFGLNAHQRMLALQDAVESGSSEWSSVDQQLQAAAQRTEVLEKSLSRLRAYGNQRDQSLKEIIAALKENNAQTIELGSRLNEWVATSAPAAVKPSATATESAAQVATAKKGSYTIQSGDTFAKIAQQNGIGLQTLLNVNPGVDPRRLGIGQTINLPTN